MEHAYEAVCSDLFGTLTDARGNAAVGAAAFLKALRDARWAVVTSAPAAVARHVLVKAQLPLPRVLVTSDDVDATKPDPACYLLAAHQLGVQPAQTLVVEDSLDGFTAARAAGMDVVLVGAARTIDGALFAVESLAAIKLRSRDGGVLLAR